MKNTVDGLRQLLVELDNDIYSEFRKQADSLGVWGMICDKVKELELYFENTWHGSAWVDVNNSLPSDSEWCLVYSDGAMACRAWSGTNKQWEDWDMCSCAGLSLEHISHWMSLPLIPVDGEIK